MTKNWFVASKLGLKDHGDGMLYRFDDDAGAVELLRFMTARGDWNMFNHFLLDKYEADHHTVQTIVDQYDFNRWWINLPNGALLDAVAEFFGWESK